jgi:hypothetical protein
MVGIGARASARYDAGAAQALAGDTCQRLVTDFVNDGTTYATLRTPVDTGRLRANNLGEVDAPAAWSCEGRMVNPVSYALAVHQGTPPHVIRPRRAQALRFEAGGEVVFAMVVHHPGTRPRPFLAEGAAAAAAAHNFIFRPVVNNI